MKTTINVEFTDHELERFLERQINRQVFSVIDQLTEALGPMVGQMLRSVAVTMSGNPVATAAAAPAGAPVPEGGGAPVPTAEENTCKAYDQPAVGFVWECHECGMCGLQQQAVCDNCGHRRCGLGGGKAAQGQIFDGYDVVRRTYPSSSLVVVVVRLNDDNNRESERRYDGVANGAALRELIAAFHGQREAATYLVRVCERTSMGILDNGKIVMPDSRVPPV